MPTTFQCPACGGIIEYSSNDQEMTCPFCGTTITTPGAASAATVIMSKVEPSPEPVESAKTVIQQQSKVLNSAEIIDEVKRSLREGDKDGAVRIYSKEFNVPMIDAQASVDQIEIDMKHSGKEAVPAPEPIPAPAPTPSAQQIPHFDVLDAAPTEEKKSNTTRNWIIGCSIAFVLFCCLCVILPTVVGFATNQFGR